MCIRDSVSSLAYLKNAVDNSSIARMTDTIFGTGKTATLPEAEAGTAHGQGGPVLTPLRGMQLLRGSNAQATEEQRGTVELATNQETADGNSTATAVTPAGLESAIGNLVSGLVEHYSGSFYTNSAYSAGSQVSVLTLPSGRNFVSGTISITTSGFEGSFALYSIGNNVYYTTPKANTVHLSGTYRYVGIN